MMIRSVCITAVCLFVVALAGCVKDRPVEETGAIREEIATQEQTEPQKPAGPSPRALASLKLTDQGRRHIETGEADSAIRVLEQAITLNPGNGQNYYYLSEAWLMKGFAEKARQFNRLAESHLTDDKDWEKLVTRQAINMVTYKNLTTERAEYTEILYRLTIIMTSVISAISAVKKNHKIRLMR
jgi:tetratricopeptide (TPR) repeat protein